MTTLKITVPVKAGKLAYYTIQFSVVNFDAVIDAVANIKSVNDLNNKLWKVI